MRLHRRNRQPGVHLRQGARGRLRSGKGDREPRPRMDDRAGLLQAPSDRALRPFGDRRAGGPAFARRASSISRASSASRCRPTGSRRCSRRSASRAASARASRCRSRSPPSSITAARGSRRSSRPPSTTRRSRPSRRASTCRKKPSYTARYPAEQPCDVRIVMSDGQALEGRCTITKGEPSKPHRPEELQAKFMQLGVPVWGERGRAAPARGLPAAGRAARFFPLCRGVRPMKLKTHGRYDYSAITERKDYSWPGGKRLAVHLCLNVEHFSFGEGLGNDYARAASAAEHAQLRLARLRQPRRRLAPARARRGLRPALRAAGQHRALRLLPADGGGVQQARRRDRRPRPHQRGAAGRHVA